MDDAGSLLEDNDFILAMARYADGLLTQAQIKKRFNFDDDTWEQLGENESLVAKIEILQEQRARSGATAREKAQKIFTRTPDILASVMDDPGQSARHRIDACKEVRTISASGPDATAADRIVIEINIGADETLRVEAEPRKPTPKIIDGTVLPANAIEDDWKR